MKAITILRNDVFQFALLEQGEQGHVSVRWLGAGQVAVGNLLAVVQQGPDTFRASVIWKMFNQIEE
jgi:hypothetical protein